MAPVGLVECLRVRESSVSRNDQNSMSGDEGK